MTSTPPTRAPGASMRETFAVRHGFENPVEHPGVGCSSELVLLGCSSELVLLVELVQMLEEPLEDVVLRRRRFVVRLDGRTAGLVGRRSELVLFVELVQMLEEPLKGASVLVLVPHAGRRVGERQPFATKGIYRR